MRGLAGVIRAWFKYEFTIPMVMGSMNRKFLFRKGDSRHNGRANEQGGGPLQ
jgi:hypothetical protein